MLAKTPCHVPPLAALMDLIGCFAAGDSLSLVRLARLSPLCGKAGLASLGTVGPEPEVLRPGPPGLRRIDRRGRAVSPRPHPDGKWTRSMTRVSDRVGTELMAERGYVPEKPATQCEGAFERGC